MMMMAAPLYSSFVNLLISVRSSTDVVMQSQVDSRHQTVLGLMEPNTKLMNFTQVRPF